MSAGQDYPLPVAPAPLTTSNRRWAVGWSIFTLSLAFLPFALGYYLQPLEGRFMGFAWNAPDGNAYLARMEAGRRGEWLIRLYYTPEDHPAILLYPFYILLGKLAGLLGLPNVLVFHLARIASGALLLWVGWRFIRRYLVVQAERRTAFLLVCWGSGLGWLAILLGLKDSTDLWVAESLTFFSILAHPHYPLATALLGLALLWILDGREAEHTEGAARAYWKAALAGFLLGAVHPFLVITLGVVAGLSLLWQDLARRKFSGLDWAGLVVVGLASLPLPVYTYLATAGQPVYAAWMRQNQTLSPAPWFYALGYGLLLIFAVAGLWRLYVQRRDIPDLSAGRWQLVTVWALAGAGLLYLPVSFQRRFVEGLHLPLALLATAGFFYLARHWPRRVQARRGYLLAIVASLSSLVVLGIFTGNLLARDSQGSVHPLYLYADEIAAFNWLRANTRPQEIVMASPLLGSYIPAHSGNRVFYGHDLESINPAHKVEQTRRFFQFEMPVEEINEFIRQYRLRFVFFGPEEGRIFAERTGEESLPFSDFEDLGWALVYKNQRVQIYQLTVGAS